MAEGVYPLLRRAVNYYTRIQVGSVMLVISLICTVIFTKTACQRETLGCKVSQFADFTAAIADPQSLNVMLYHLYICRENGEIINLSSWL